MKRRRHWQGLSGTRRDHSEAFHEAFAGARDTADAVVDHLKASRCGAVLRPLVEHFLNQGAMEAHFVELGRPGSGPHTEEETATMTAMRDVRRRLFSEFESRCGLRVASETTIPTAEGREGAGGEIEF